jgi:hypothetical protein
MLHSGSAGPEEAVMIGTVRGPAALLVVLVAVPIWSAAPGPLAPVPVRAATQTTETTRDVTFENCIFRLINRYSADDESQSALTRQVRTEDCHFGDRNGTILVRACYEAPGGDNGPDDCSPWLRPTSTSPYAESKVISPVPRDSIHYVEIRGTVKRFDLAAPEVAPAPDPPPAAAPAPTTPAEPAPAPEPPPPTATATADPDPAPTSPAAGSSSPGSAAAPPSGPAAPPPPDRRPGLAAVLATGGVSLLGLGSTGIWLLRRSRPSPW